MKVATWRSVCRRTGAGHAAILHVMKCRPRVAEAVVTLEIDSGKSGPRGGMGQGTGNVDSGVVW
jgi:hypothetical protein